MPEFLARGADVSDVQDLDWGRFVFFADPDGDSRALQRLPPQADRQRLSLRAVNRATLDRQAPAAPDEMPRRGRRSGTWADCRPRRRSVGLTAGRPGTWLPRRRRAAGCRRRLRNGHGCAGRLVLER